MDLLQVSSSNYSKKTRESERGKIKRARENKNEKKKKEEEETCQAHLSETRLHCFMHFGVQDSVHRHSFVKGFEPIKT